MKSLIGLIRNVAVVAASLAPAVTGCSRSPDAKVDTAAPGPAVPTAQSTPANTGPAMIRGTVVSVSGTQLVLQSDSGNVTVNLVQPFHVYARVPSDLAHVKATSFIGVTTVKQPDGAERATEIHVFPEELRGVGEGSRMMAPDTTANASRMTNGSVSASRMSNGSVRSTNGSTLVVQYAGGSQTVTVPPNTPVTEFKLASKPVTAGDRLAVLTTKAANGMLTADRALSTAK